MVLIVNHHAALEITQGSGIIPDVIIVFTNLRIGLDNDSGSSRTLGCYLLVHHYGKILPASVFVALSGAGKGRVHIGCPGE